MYIISILNLMIRNHTNIIGLILICIRQHFIYPQFKKWEIYLSQNAGAVWLNVRRPIGTLFEA